MVKHPPANPPRRRLRAVVTAAALLGASSTFVAGAPGPAWSASQPRLLALPQSEAALPAGTVGDPSALPAQIEVSVALKPRDPAGAASFASDVSDPTSPLFHHFLTSAQYTERFGPTRQSVASVSSYLAGKGLRVLSVSGNRQVVTAVGSPSAVDSAMSVKIAGYRSASGQKFYEAPGRAAATHRASSRPRTG